MKLMMKSSMDRLKASSPAAMTPGCTTQACDFRDNLASLQAAGSVTSTASASVRGRTVTSTRTGP